MRLLNQNTCSKATKPQVRCFRLKSRQKGFTLTEVVLALGIVAFAFIPVLGLLPLGLDTSRQAIDTTIEAQIAQSLSNKALQADFSNLTSLTNSNPVYFDSQGNKTSSADSGIYKVSFDIANSTELPNSGTTDKLATVTICILNTKGRGYNKEQDPLKNTAAKKFALLISDNGR